MAKRMFEYGEAETAYLRERDPELGELIDRYGFQEREIEEDLFVSLVSTIISQQISGKAAVTVYNRLEERFGGIDAEKLALAPAEEIQKAGMSMRKAGYIKSAAEAVCGGGLDIELLRGMNNDELEKTLVGLKGIGKWTAEMLMIFSLGRPDVLSYLDLGIRRGICSLHGHDELSPEEFERYRELYSPYGSVASLYLWALSDEVSGK